MAHDVNAQDVKNAHGPSESLFWHLAEVHEYANFSGRGLQQPGECV